MNSVANPARGDSTACVHRGVSSGNPNHGSLLHGTTLALRPATRFACLALTLAALVWPAHAQEDEGFRFSTGAQLQHDDNLFRLPPGADAVTLLGRSDASDALLVTSAGVGFERRYSLQKIFAEFQLVDYNFQRFSQFDLSATNYGLRWEWAYTPQLQGRLLAERRETLDSFDGAATSLANGNRRLQTRQGVDLRYELDGRWSLQSGLFHRQDRRDQATVGEDGFRQNTLEAGVQRSFGSGSQITARLSRDLGRNLNSTLVVGDSYHQNNLWVDLLWKASGLTSAEFSLNALNRSHPAASALDYNGLSASGSVKWQPTGKLLWTLSGSSLLDSYQGLSSTHARTDKLGLDGLWSITARTALRAGVQQSRLRLLGHPTGGITNPRRDSERETALTLTWKPGDLFTLESSLKNRKRDSNQSVFDYSSTLFSLGLTASF